MIITFNIPNDTLQRLSDALTMEGYVYDPLLETTDNQQRLAFFKQLTIYHWRSIVFNYERQLAVDNEPNDTAALQAARFVGLANIIIS